MLESWRCIVSPNECMMHSWNMYWHGNGECGTDCGMEIQQGVEWEGLASANDSDIIMQSTVQAATAYGLCSLSITFLSRINDKVKSVFP